MWRGDSIQLVIDASGAAITGGRVNNYHEIGFAPQPDGSAALHLWDGAADLSQVTAKTIWTEDGYLLSVSMPWSALSIDPNTLPVDLGVNVVVNDGGPKGAKRRFLEWTPGTARVKNRSVFARAVIVPSGAATASFLKANASNYDTSDKIGLTYIQYTQAGLPAGMLRSQISDPAGNPLPPVWPESTLEPLPAGACRIVRLSAPAASLPVEGDYPVTLSCSPENPDRTASVQAVVKRYDLHSRVAALRKSLRDNLSEIKTLVAADSVAPTDKAILASLSIADRFLDRVGAPDVTRKQSIEWSLLQVNEVSALLADIRTRIDKKPSNSLPDRSETIYDSAHTPAKYAYGYGHFSEVVRDLPFLAGTGTTLIQQERGPRDMLPDGTITPNINSARNLLDRAGSNGAKVDFLLSPHYFPEWALAADPSLKVIEPSGTLRYNIDHPMAREIFQNWIERFLPTIKDHPALASLCISNEPTYLNSGRDSHSRPAWTEYLRQTHDSISSLNTLYGTSYAGFPEVPPPPTKDEPDSLNARRAFYDWMRFNHRHFSEWHRWMNSLVKSTAPGSPTHSKIMMDIFTPGLLARSAEPELMCETTDMAGCDAYAWPSPWRDYAYNWLHVSMWYDLLHSFKGQPVFNSENHLIRDGSPAEHISPDHTRTVLWQGALHHMTDSAIWVWAEGSVPDLEGSIYFRPANIDAAARAMIDLQRLSSPVSAISNAKAKVAVLYSVTSIYWSNDYIPALSSAYTALNFIGQPVTFMSEKQLAENRRTPATDEVRVLIVPRATHLSDATVNGLAEFAKAGGIIIPLGEGNMTRDEYDRPRALPAELQPARLANSQPWQPGYDSKSDRQLSQALNLVLANHRLDQPALLSVSESGAKHQPAWGVEYRVVRTSPGRTLIQLTNFLPASQTVSIVLPESSGDTALDLLNGETIDLRQIPLTSLHPRLLEISTPPRPPAVVPNARPHRFRR